MKIEGLTKRMIVYLIAQDVIQNSDQDKFGDYSREDLIHFINDEIKIYQVQNEIEYNNDKDRA